MINGIVNKIACEICGGALTFSSTLTIDDYTIAITADSSNISNKVDEIIGKYLVYECYDCHAKYKYTYRDLERYLRKDLTQRMLLLVVKNMVADNSNAVKNKFFFYCGKCNGYDGNGSCPKSMYTKCEIKRFPTNG
jgi:hypothetical protein